MRAYVIACIAFAAIGPVFGGTPEQTPDGDNSAPATERKSALKAAAGLVPQEPCVLGEVPEKSAKDVGFTQRWGELSEKARLKLRAEAGWQWKFPGENPAYAAMQEKRYDEIQGLYHFQERLDNWVQYVQVRSVKNFTDLGFAVVNAPTELHQRLKAKLHASLEAKSFRSEMNGRPAQGIYGDTYPDFVDHGERSILQELQPIHEEWTPSAGPLRPITAYGMRIYRRGASLAFHADRVDTHVVSSIFHVDHSYDDEDEPWSIEIEGHDGKRHSVSLQPGQMLLYESAKCPHGRSTSLKGDWYASVFSHYKPVQGWPYTQQDIWLAVPPEWNAPPITQQGSGRWVGAFLTHDAMEVAGMPARAPKDLHRPPRLRALPAAIQPSPPKEDATAAAAAAAAGAAASAAAARTAASATNSARSEATAASAAATAAASYVQQPGQRAELLNHTWAAAKSFTDAAAVHAHGAKKSVLSAHATASRALQGALDATNDRFRGRNATQSSGSSSSSSRGDSNNRGKKKQRVPKVHPNPHPEAAAAADSEADSATNGEGSRPARRASSSSSSEKGEPSEPIRLKRQAPVVDDDDDHNNDASSVEGSEGAAGELLETAVEAGAVTGAVALFVWFAGGGTLVGLVLLLRRLCLTRGRSITRRTHLKADDLA